jgi:hypothetical protein
MHHEPKPAFLVLLNFNEMVSTPERCELGRAFIPPDRVQTGMAEGVILYAPRLRNDRIPISTAGRHSAAKSG